jgi:NADH-quinone oxidoreductase subunit M
MDLSILLWLPAAAALFGALLPGRSARAGAVAGSVVTLGLSIAMLADFETGQKGLQFLTDKPWIAELGIHYKLGVDGLNIFFILLATLIFAATFVWAATQEWERERGFYLWLGIAETGVLGALLVQDLALFVGFFDLMLIPFYFLAGQWGGPGRVAGVTKLIIYTLVGSLFMLAAAVATAVLTANNGDGQLNFDIAHLAQNTLGKGSQDWIFLCFAAAFLVKMPLFPLHGWMPDGYRAMPMPVLAVFSAVLSKVAAYGFLRIVLPLFPDATVHFQDLMLLIALASILYASAMAFTTTDARLILGYSSVAQLGFIVLGIFSLRSQGSQGAILQSVNHGLVVAPAFFIVSFLAARSGGSEDIRDMGAIAFRAPVFATLFLIVAFANLAMPGSSNFVGEFLILLGVFNAKLAIAVIAFTGVGLASVYTLRLFTRAVHNRAGAGTESREMGFTDGLVLVPLVAVILFLAVYPQFVLKRTDNGTTGGGGAKVAALR